MEGEEIAQIESVETFGPGFAGGDKVEVILDGAAAHAAAFGFVEGGEKVLRVENYGAELRGDPLAEQHRGIRCGHAEPESPAGEGAERLGQAWARTE